MLYNVTSDDYSFAEDGESDVWAIRLKTKYAGVVYHYGQVQAKIDDDEGNATLAFKYAIIDPADNELEELQSSKDFNNYIGAVLQHIIEDAFDSGNYRLGENASDNSNNGTSEPSEQ
jgi:hypothetical protein